MCSFLLNLEKHSIFYLNEKQLLCASVCLTTGVNEFLNGYSTYRMCLGRPVKGLFSKPTTQWKFKISKILNFRNFNLKACSMHTRYHNFKFKWSVVLRQTENKSEKLTNVLNSAFWGWLSVESHSQNPEFRNNPENFHPWQPPQVLIYLSIYRQ